MRIEGAQGNGSGGGLITTRPEGMETTEAPDESSRLCPDCGAEWGVFRVCGRVVVRFCRTCEDLRGDE